jgi:hypothetical protein
MELAHEIEARYQRYLKTTFYFRDPVLRTSFEMALDSGHLRKGPYLEATPVFKRGQAPGSLFPALLGFQPDAGFLKAAQGSSLSTHTKKKQSSECFRDTMWLSPQEQGAAKQRPFCTPYFSIFTGNSSQANWDRAFAR